MAAFAAAAGTQKAAAAAPQQPLPQQPAGKSGQQGQGGEGAAGDKTPPPPDTRTWWQKNWVFVLGGGMMVLNALLKGQVRSLRAAVRVCGGGGGHATAYRT
jgi:hypothetical protein